MPGKHSAFAVLRICGIVASCLSDDFLNNRDGFMLKTVFVCLLSAVLCLVLSCSSSDSEKKADAKMQKAIESSPGFVALKDISKALGEYRAANRRWPDSYAELLGWMKNTGKSTEQLEKQFESVDITTSRSGKKENLKIAYILKGNVTKGVLNFNLSLDILDNMSSETQGKPKK